MAASRKGTWVRNYEDAEFDVPFLPPSTTTVAPSTDGSRRSPYQGLFHGQHHTKDLPPPPSHNSLASPPSSFPRQYQPIEQSPFDSSPPSPVLLPVSLSQDITPRSQLQPMSSTQSLPATNAPQPSNSTSSSTSSTSQPQSINSRSSSSNNNEVPMPRSPTSPTPSSFRPPLPTPTSRTFSPSPLGPTSPSLGPTSPFARPGSRTSAYINRIASEESRALSSTPLPGTLSSRGSMILYRLADDPLLNPSGPPSARHSQYLTDSSFNTMGTTDEQGLLVPPNAFSGLGNRASVVSNSESILSLSSDSKYPAALQHTTERGLVAYAYDPELDELGPADEEDLLHDPNEKDTRDGRRPMGWRGFLNIATIVLLLLALLTLFVAYPVIAFMNDNGRNAKIVGNTRINSTGQAVEPPFGFSDDVTTTSTTRVVPPPPAATPTRTTATRTTATTPTETETDTGTGTGADAGAGDEDPTGAGGVGTGIGAGTGAGTGGVDGAGTGADDGTGAGTGGVGGAGTGADDGTGAGTGADNPVTPGTGAGAGAGAGLGGDETVTGAADTTLKRKSIPLRSRGNPKSQAKVRNFSSS